ncbi:MAG: FixH family protein [Bacteroidia bacterium]|nr:FixH family protein [Bacteroidia bacterium]
MNWSTRIIILYVGFVALILALVFGASSQTFQLVTEDYYAEELDYQAQIYASQNAQELATPLTVYTDMATKTMILHFPPEQVSVQGEVNFYRPDNADQDKQVVLRMTNGQQEINLAGMARGRWITKVRWESEGKPFFHEEGLFIP